MQASNVRNTATGAGNNMMPQPPPLKRSKLQPTGGKLMRLRCRFRTLHESYLTNGVINDKDADVTFITMEGQQVFAHKIILCSASTHFSAIFADQLAGEMTYVMVPDVRVETMRLILQLAYTESVNLTMKQIKEVGSFISLFGMEWKQFNFDGFDDTMMQGHNSAKAENFSNSSVSISPLMRQFKQPKREAVGSSHNYLDNQAAQQSASGGQTHDDNSHDSDDFTFKLQGYDQVAAGNQNAANSSQLRQQLTSQMNNRKPQLTYGRSPPGKEFGKQRAGNMPRSQNYASASRTETGNNETQMGNASSGEDPQKLISDWMAKVGKDDTNSAKRLRTALSVARKDKPAATTIRAPTPPLAANQAVNTCTVCNAKFADRTTWKWHEERHIGMGIFKCGYCNSLFGTSKKLIQHEEAAHGCSVAPQIANAAVDIEDDGPESLDAARGRKLKLIPRQEYVENSPAQRAVPPLTLVKSNNKHGIKYTRVVPATAVKSNLKIIANKAISKAVNRGAHKIDIGQSVGAEQMDANKLKQLHWMYNCLKCDSCSDKSQKALQHYYVCYPDKEVPFENSVVKYRQGFYGKFRCPLCPRRYTSIGGFVIHCGHMHTDYRKAFAQTQKGDLKCLQCKVDFALPIEFSDHLVDGQCPASGTLTTTTSQQGNGEAPANKKARAAPKKEENPYDDMLAKRRSQTYIGRSPRSARLANRIINETLAKNIDSVDETAFGSIDCPVCGADSITNINDHLTTDHSELGIEVQRLSEDLLRCRKCKLTFAICDLFSHSNSCTGSKEFEFVNQQRRAAKNKPPSPNKPVEVKKVLTIPDGVGDSQIDKFDFEDLNSVATLANALKCRVCGKVARKLGVISECYKTHGINRCALCFNTYKSKMDYTLHLKQMHGQGASGKLNCPICSKLMVNVGQVASHMFKLHWIALIRETKNFDGTTVEDKQGPGIEGKSADTLETVPQGDSNAPSSTDDTTHNIVELDKTENNDKVSVALMRPALETVVPDNSNSKIEENAKPIEISESETCASTQNKSSEPADDNKINECSEKEDKDDVSKENDVRKGDTITQETAEK